MRTLIISVLICLTINIINAQSDSLFIRDNLSGEHIHISPKNALSIKSKEGKYVGVFHDITKDRIVVKDRKTGVLESILVSNVSMIQEVELKTRNLFAGSTYIFLGTNSVFWGYIGTLLIGYDAGPVWGGVTAAVALIVTPIFLIKGMRNIKGFKRVSRKYFVGKGTMKQSNNGNEYIEGSRYSLIIKKASTKK